MKKRSCLTKMLFSRIIALSGVFFLLLACDQNSNTVERQVPQSRKGVEFTFSPVVKEFAPAVVNIYVHNDVPTKAPMDKFMDDPFYKQYMDRSHGPEATHKVNSMGSGVIVSAEGHILTNYHVVEGGEAIKVVLHDRREFDAKVVQSEQRTDLVMLKIDAGSEKLPEAQLDQADNIEVGDVVLAIGNPFGVGQSVSMGIISAVGRSQAGISDFRSFLQTDASINPGNSGGALITTDGRLIGINTAIYSKSGESIGIGFAIPSSLVTPFVENAIQGKRTERPWMGIGIRGIDSKMAKKLGFSRPYGVLIVDVYKGAAADKAGIQVGDILTHFNGNLIDDDAELDYVLSRQHLNTTVTFKLLRNGIEKDVQVEMVPAPRASTQDSFEIDAKNPFTGAIVAELSPALALEAGMDPLERGVVLLEIKAQSTAQKMNFKIGDLIHSINERPILSLKDLFQVMKNPPQKWMIKFFRQGKMLTVKDGKN